MADRFTVSDCWQLAYALHQRTGWPMVAVAEVPDLDEGSAEIAASNRALGWCHVAVRRPDGLLVDAGGTQTEDELLDQYADFLDEPDLADVLEVPAARFTQMLGENPTLIDDEARTAAATVASFPGSARADHTQSPARPAAAPPAAAPTPHGPDF